MNIYVETNFVLELALMQEEHDSCEQLLEICEAGKARLIVPAYSLIEPYETLIRRDMNRRAIANTLETELNQLSRSAPYKAEIDPLRAIINLLVQSGSEERQRLTRLRERLLDITEIVPIGKDILASAQAHEMQHGLSPQDAIVFASTLWRLSQSNSHSNCFINRNTKDFGDPDIKDVLDQYDCRILFKFSDGLNYVQSQITYDLDCYDTWAAARASRSMRRCRDQRQRKRPGRIDSQNRPPLSQ